MTFSQRDINQYHTLLLEWFSKEAKSYPWRQTQDPWSILVSEIMLQQTQIATVLSKNYYTNFLKTFPTPTSMAHASEQRVLRAWEGLGYYRRAKNLHALAQCLLKEHNGIFPTDYATLLQLPGIGPYTAGAVCSFAYNQPTPIVDTNVARVFSRLFCLSTPIDSAQGQRTLWDYAQKLLDKENPRLYNAALMELGQLFCKNKHPLCHACPMRALCPAPPPDCYPRKKNRQKTQIHYEHALFAKNSQGDILLAKQKKGQRREHMWLLPRRDASFFKQASPLVTSRYSITRYAVTLNVYPIVSSALTIQDNEQWHAINELDCLPIPSPERRSLEKIFTSLPLFPS